MVGSSFARRASRAVCAAVVVGGLVVGADPSGVAAQDGEQFELVDTIEFAETGVESPLAPGLAAQATFDFGPGSPIAGPTGFFDISADGNDLEFTEISLSGAVSTEVVTTSATFDVSVRPLQATADFVLAEAVEYGGIIGINYGPVDVSLFRVDRSTGALSAGPPTDDLDGAARMSDDGSIVAANAVVPFWGEFDSGGITNAQGFTDDEDFSETQLVPTLSADGRFAAVSGFRETEAVPTMELWVKDTSGGDDQFIELPCPIQTCTYEVDLISTRGGETSVFVTASSVEIGLGGIVVLDVDHYRVFLDDGRAVTSVPVSVGSPNGRYVAGRAAMPGSLELSATDFVVHDLDTGRERTFASNLPESYSTEIIGLSDDGLTLRYTSRSICTGVCVIEPSYFGSIELLPVADVTPGPAADQMLRLYRAVFGRIPDAEGFDFWMDRYREGQPLVDIAAAFAASSEYVTRFGASPTDEELVDALYQNTLGRAGDAEGVAFWLDRRAAGASIPAILVAFADSPENIERTGTRSPITVPEGRVTRIYRAVLGRAPDSGGLAFWVGEYNDGVTLAEMARRFTGQSEYTALYGVDPADDFLVDAVYLNVLGRPGDSIGVAFWIDRLGSGLTVPELFVSFADSPENVELTGTVR